MIVNGTDRTVRAAMTVASRDAVALWLGIEPSDFIGWTLTDGQLTVAYRDDENGLLTRPGCVFPIHRRLTVKTTREIDAR